MKRIFTLLAAISMVLSAMAQTAGITLAYNKGEKMLFYPANKLAQAIEDAKPNDILYFSAGHFDLGYLPQSDYGNGYEITKPLTFIGAGAFDSDKGTYFYIGNWAWNLYLNVDKTKYDSDVNFAFEGIKFDRGSEHYLRPISDIDELVFRNFYGRITTNTDDDREFLIDNLLLERCDLYSLDIKGDHVKKASMNNTKIEDRIYGGCAVSSDESENNGNLMSIDHCRIRYVDSSFSGYIQNSFVREVESSSVALESCGYYSASSDVDKNNCFEISYWDLEANDNDPSQFGNYPDGTPYGTTGGIEPYSLYSSYPTPDSQESSFDYDKVNGTLNITIKLKGTEDTNNN